VTTAIKTSLSKLNQSLTTLETAVEHAESKAASPKSSQRDLFGVVTGIKKQAKDNNAASAANDIDPKILANRLDTAIAKVEQILQEERA